GEFAFAGAAPVVAPLQIKELLGLAAPEILGAAAIGMLAQTPVDVGGNRGVKGVVGTKDDVDLPVHGRLPALANKSGTRERPWLRSHAGAGERWIVSLLVGAEWQRPHPYPLPEGEGEFGCGSNKKGGPFGRPSLHFFLFYFCVSRCTQSTMKMAFSGGTVGRMPCPRLKMRPGRSAFSASTRFTSRSMISLGAKS